ncbi:LTA synthase family protein [Campylobacter aviculae]|uniref:Sulfatase n=1 Tax=Campylobacter aviculae TaxID=2510190 RepID=A0A4U7BUM2_9BACT|nr:LTA synthase family protein [Campylobacter aviculae]TKX33126.1 sulfatase [Campylobacter aviculae]
MRKVLLQIIIFSLLFIVVFTINRALMQLNFIPGNLVSDKNEFIQMYLLGAYHDIRFLSVAFLPLLLCSFIALVFSKKKRNLTIGGGVLKTYRIASSFYIAFISFICIGFSYAKYYYYEIYKSKFDIFIFGLKDDNAQAILNIIYNDYPILKILILMFVFGIFCVFINLKILGLKLKPINLKFSMLILLNFILIGIYILALRGPFRHVAINVQNYSFSQLSVLNDTMLNPIMAFSWAFKQYRQEESFKTISSLKAQELKNKLFDDLHTSPKNIQAEKIHPSVFVNLMESFGLNLADFSNEEHNFLGALQPHFEKDFVFKRFLSAYNGTIPSFANLFFLSPFQYISTSKFQKTYLDLTPIAVYKKAGYRVIFVSAGNGSWQNVKNYLGVLGVDEIIDENVLMKEYKQAKISENGYGIADKYLYKKVYELLQENPHNTLIIGLTISNHPPYKIAQEGLPKLENIPQALLDLLPYEKSKQENIIKAYTYANNEFGKFLDKVKQSSFKDSVIIAATGDHRVREMGIDLNSQKAFAYSVPFYLYVPKILQNDIYYDKNRLGSHKDIFPTLYALSLSNVHYLSLGGRNMLAKPKDEKLEFAFNDVVWADKNGVYIGDKGYFFENNHTLKDNNKAFKLDEYHKNFAQFYNELNFYQLGQRLGIAK